MSVLEIIGLILFVMTFILICFLFSKMEKIKTKKWIAIAGLALLGIINIISIGLFIHKEFGSNGWSRCSTIALGFSIFILESSFAILFLGYSSSKQFKFIGLLFISILCLHCSLELANVNYLNHKIEEVKDQPQQSEDSEELKEEREKITGRSITSNILSHSFQTFTLDLDYTGTFIENGYLSSTCQKTVGVLGILLTILAPVAGGFVLLSIVSNIFPVLKLYLVCLAPWKKKIYIFSELNEHSIITAESILNEKYRFKPVIIFTDVYTDKSKEMSSELLDRAKKIGAICLSTDITFLNLRKAFLKWVPPIFPKNFIFLFMDLEDSSNLKTTIDLLAVGSTPKSKTLIEQNIIGQFNKKRLVEIYVFASKLPQATKQLKKAEEKLIEHFSKRKKKETKEYTKPFCCIVDVIQNVVSSFIFKESKDDSDKSLFQLAININKDKDELNVLILGNDLISKTFAKVLFEMGEILQKTKAISIKVLDITNNEHSSDSKEDNAVEHYQDIQEVQYKDEDFQYKLISFGEDESNLKALEKLKLKNFTHLNFVMEDEKLGEIYKENNYNPVFSSKERYDIANIRYVFYGLREEEEIIIPPSIPYIGSNAFYGCEKLKKITIEEGTKNIGSKAFYGCDQLSEIRIPKSLKIIGNYTFIGCTNLKKIFYNGTINDWSKICFELYSSNPLIWGGTLFFKNCENKLSKIKISRNIKKIGRYQFCNFKNLKQIKLFKRIKIIDSYAFAGCDHLENIDIPDSVTSIGERAFYNCRSLTSITIPDSVASIGERAFEGCRSLQYNEYDNALYLGNSDNPYLWLVKAKDTSITECIINKKTRFIYRSAFYDCRNLTSVYYEGSIEDWCKIKFNDNLFQYSSNSHHFYIRNAKNEWKEVTRIEIPEGITKIGKYQFYGFNNVTSITIPNSVTSIGDSAFEDCSNLTSVYYEGSIEDWCKIKSNGSLFDYSSNSNHFYIRNAKNEWEEVTRIEIPEGITKIGKYQFYGFNNVTSITIPDSITSIGRFAFSYCRNLTSVVIGNSVTSIGDRAFEDCSNLTSVVIGNSVTSIGYGAFYKCYRLVEVYNLSNINITAGSANHGYVRMFDNSDLEYILGLARYLSNINITAGSANHGYVGYYAKVINTSLKEMSRLIEKDDYIFYKDENNKYYLLSYKGTDTELVLPNDIEGNNYAINQYAFSYCSNLTSITIPNSVTSIGERAFEGCRSLQLIIYEGTKEQWMKFNVEKPNEQCVIRCDDGDI